MRRIREVLRLKHECALPNAQIAAALGIAKGSVANYLAAATAAGLTHSEAQALDDAALNARLHPQRYVYPQFAVPDFGADPSRAAAQGRHAAIAVGGVSGASPGRSLQPVALLRALHRVSATAAPLDAADPCRRREAVRRLRRADRPADRPGQWRDHPRPHLRRGVGRLELHLCRGHRRRVEGRLDRGARQRADVLWRRARRSWCRTIHAP